MHVNSELVHFEITVDENGVWQAVLRARSRHHLLVLAETLVDVLDGDGTAATVGPDVVISKPEP